MSKYLNDMKDALRRYLTAAQKAEREIMAIDRDYKPEVRKEKISDIKFALSNERVKAVDAIMAAKRGGLAEAERWGELRVGDLTSDKELLSIGLRLTQAEYDNLCRKYTSNGSMSRLLDEYATKNNRELAYQNPGVLFPPGYLTRTYLQTPEKIGEKWEKMAATAENVLASIDRTGYYGGANNPMVINSVENFGNNAEGI